MTTKAELERQLKKEIAHRRALERLVKRIYAAWQREGWAEGETLRDVIMSRPSYLIIEDDHEKRTT